MHGKYVRIHPREIRREFRRKRGATLIPGNEIVKTKRDLLILGSGYV